MVGRGRGLSQVTSASSPQMPWYCSAAVGALLPASWCYPGPAAPHPPVYIDPAASDTPIQDAIAAGDALTKQQNLDFFGALSQQLPGSLPEFGGVDPAAYATSGGKTAQPKPGQADYTTLLLMGGGVLMLFLVMMKRK